MCVSNYQALHVVPKISSWNGRKRCHQTPRLTWWPCSFLAVPACLVCSYQISEKPKPGGELRTLLEYQTPLPVLLGPGGWVKILIFSMWPTMVPTIGSPPHRRPSLYGSLCGNVSRTEFGSSDILNRCLCYPWQIMVVSHDSEMKASSGISQDSRALPKVEESRWWICS